MTDAIVIGAGPAGLMAAEELAKSGVTVTVVDAMPSVGRKFLMAGKSGLNITKSESNSAFQAAFGSNLPKALKSALDQFGPKEVVAWAEALEQPTFLGSTGRVFPKTMKASPLLRAWLSRLAELGVRFETRWRWQGWQGDTLVFDTPTGAQQLTPKATIVATGGASWARLGANGAWATYLADDVTPFRPANMGLIIDWSDHMAPLLGKPVKAIALTAGNQRSNGEFTLSKTGIEGGGVYTVSAAVRDGAPLTLDLLPDWTLEKLRDVLQKPRSKTTVSNYLRKTLKLGPTKLALLMEFGRPLPNDLAPLIKNLPIRHKGPPPMDEAISTAGGVRFDAMDDALMLRAKPGVFCAGEMLDWEAPTGGYLITACLATGRLAGKAAAAYLDA